MIYSESDEVRFWAKVDKTKGECWEWAASRKPNGYGQFMMYPKLRYAHRVAYEMVYGAVPVGSDLDHICHNRACVRPQHLRATTRKQNLENHSGPKPGTSSGARGVSWHKATGTWDVRVVHNGVTHRPGRYIDLGEAEAAAIELRNRLHTHNDADRLAA